MWNYEMALNELNTVACGGEGNVVAWESLTERGSSTKSVQTFPTCGNFIVCNFVWITVWNILALWFIFLNLQHIGCSVSFIFF